MVTLYLCHHHHHACKLRVPVRYLSGVPVHEAHWRRLLWDDPPIRPVYRFHCVAG
ncbi:uncharacterized protein BCR38DRAFT_437944 [Pseudomassariella vexata]|uniref:Uncharacterized protein n=1 Tax=Pseudomassariella vexata TaxID=1141098 RepID=A0A1Y2DSI8_9PEZI|nr:uncharacterized protein BCR38DRAFT_437944 [Pseudomassariella vexata]ORY62251.1 hypothetical protein BCR38DRAFT_437944 [Pseudomassariella vexata]